jgi:C-terminal processing protease CtpA/Prc
MKDDVFCFVNNPHIDSSLWGAKINTINHISCDSLTALAKLYMSFEEYHYFPFEDNVFFMQHLLHGIQDTILLEYEIADKKGAIKFDVKECVNLWKLAENENGLQKGELPFDYRIFKDDAIALLELNSFLEENVDNVKYSEFLNTFFDSINSSGIQHLFIDISANGGGSDEYSYMLLEYLAKDSTYYLGKLLFKNSAERKKFLRKHDREMYRDYVKMAKNKDFYLKKTIWEKESPDSAIRYKNNIYLIQSRQTASAATSIVNFIKTYKIGITIGTEISDGIAFYANLMPFEMKHSKLYFTCASSYYMGVGAENEPVKDRIQPDILYPIPNPFKNFTIKQLKEMLQLIERYNTHNKLIQRTNN